MTIADKTNSHKTPVRRLFELTLIIVVVAYVVPSIKDALFPDQMTQLEKMLRRSVFAGCSFKVERRDRLTLIATVEFPGRAPITTQIYRDVVHELKPSDGKRIFFAHSINDNADGVTYLTRTLIEADKDLKHVRRLEVSVCGRIKNQTGQVSYKDHEPIYECDGPIRKAVCLAAE